MHEATLYRFASFHLPLAQALDNSGAVDLTKMIYLNQALFLLHILQNSFP